MSVDNFFHMSIAIICKVKARIPTYVYDEYKFSELELECTRKVDWIGRGTFYVCMPLDVSWIRDLDDCCFELELLSRKNANLFITFYQSSRNTSKCHTHRCTYLKKKTKE